jgi:hypothetical protein
MWNGYNSRITTYSDAGGVKGWVRSFGSSEIDVDLLLIEDIIRMSGFR